MASELSRAENIVRIAMHPADQVIGFTKLANAGLSVAAIAARFGTSERLVEHRLCLGNVAPDLLDAYRAHEIDREVLKAFSVTADHARQMAAWEQVAGQSWGTTRVRSRRRRKWWTSSAGATARRCLVDEGRQRGRGGWVFDPRSASGAVI